MRRRENSKEKRVSGKASDEGYWELAIGYWCNRKFWNLLWERRLILIKSVHCAKAGSRREEVWRCLEVGGGGRGASLVGRYLGVRTGWAGGRFFLGKWCPFGNSLKICEITSENRSSGFLGLRRSCLSLSEFVFLLAAVVNEEERSGLVEDLVGWDEDLGSSSSPSKFWDVRTWVFEISTVSETPIIRETDLDSPLPC
ncbi:hypothetical protein H6P81_007774 [Aristolochia fimbriata]|uniref:Uncharacterized protein n=1 Tax=Aristolochia fimbriata TaxID=158543 RepID=A0AAV7F3H0_ARIFI|nr:hypothetical protein H6P81_007774 [Aristolochia fimbriata]